MIASCLPTSRLHAQSTLVLRNHESDVAVSPFAYQFTDKASLEGFESVFHAQPTKFIRNTSSHEINYGLDKTRAWCVIHVRNESHEQNWILKINQGRVDTVQLYVVRAGIAEKLPITGHFQKFSERPVHSLPFAYALTIKKNTELALYLYTSRQYGKHAPIVSLQSKDQFEIYQYGFNVVLGFVCGMVLLAALVGFFLFVFVRQKLYIYYSIYAISFFFVLLADTGFAHAALFFPVDQTVANGFTMIFYYWMGGCLGLFTIELLQLKQDPRRWRYWFGVVFSCALCVFALTLLIPGLPHIIR
jgi:hypothetical protein